MRVFRKIMALMLSLVMVASMSTALVFAEEGIEPMAAGVSYVFSLKSGPEQPAIGISSYDFDAEKSESGRVNFEIYNASTMQKQIIDLGKVKVNNTPMPSAKYETDAFVVALKGPNGTFKEIEFTPKKDGKVTIGYMGEDGIAASLEITIINKKVQPNYFKMIYDSTNNSQNGRPLSGERQGSGRGDSVITMVRPFHFAEFSGADNKWVKGYELTDTPYTLIRKQVGGDQVGEEVLKKIFEETTDNAGMKALAIRPLEYGKFELSAEITINRTKYTTAPYTLEVAPLEKPVIYELKQNESINDILANTAIFPEMTDADKDGVDDNYGFRNYVIVLAEDGVYAHAKDEIVTLTKPIIIDGRGTTTLKSQIVIDLDVKNNIRGETLRARVEKTTLKSREAGKGTGITDTDRGRHIVPFSGAGLTIDGFETGVDMVGDTIRVGGIVQNCGVGMKVFVRSNGISITHEGQYLNNDIALLIKNTPNHSKNPFALGFAYSNFIGNRINIKNEATDVIFNFSFNHYDGEVSQEQFINVNCSPYYVSKIDIKQGIPTTEFPKDMAVTTWELESTARSMPKPIDVANNLLKPNAMLRTDNFGDKNVVLDLVDVNDKEGEYTAKTAGWAFSGMANNGVNAFNPAIATDLRDSSDTAVSTLPTGTKYQPVSFAHSGKLPGTADVSVVKTADAPIANLKLYKVVGDKLVLQPEAVTFNDKGEFLFKRDDASDYIITDTEISTGDGGKDDNKGNSGGGSNDYTGPEEATDKLDKAPAGGSASIDVSGKPKVSSSIFDVLKKNPGKTLVLKGDGYSWSFKGSDLTQSIPGLLAVDTSISKKSPNEAAIKKLTGDAPIQNVYFSYHGLLPGKATIELEVEKSFGDKPLNLYYFNAATNKLSLVQSGLRPKNSKVAFSITHCSDYLLTPDTLPGAGAAAVAMTNPDTGARDIAPIAMAIAIIAGLGAVALMRTKKKE